MNGFHLIVINYTNGGTKIWPECLTNCQKPYMLHIGVSNGSYLPKGRYEFMKKCRKLFLVFFSLLLIMLMAAGCEKKVNTETTRKDFDSFTNEVFKKEVTQDTLTLNFSLANPKNYGITKSPVTFGHYSISEKKDSLLAAENYLAALKGFSYRGLNDSQKLTYDILKKLWTLQLTSGKFPLYNEILGPTTGLQAQLPVLLAEYNFYTKEDIETYLKLLPDISRYFKEICQFEKQKSKAGLFMSDTVADSILAQCEAFVADKDNNYLIEVFNDKVSSYDGLTKKEIKAYEKTNKKAVLNNVIPAYQLLIDTLNSLKGTGTNDGGLAGLPNGKAYYRYLLASNTGTNRSPEELIKMLDSSILSNLKDLNALAKKDSKIYQEASSVSYPLSKPKEILEYLRSAVNEDFPPCPNVNFTVKYVHKSLQEYLSPAMYLVPAIDNYKNNVIYINENPDYKNQQIFNTLAHEGYPGHLYQSVYFRNTNPSPIRSLLSFGGYAEGWATYVEFYSYHLAGFPESQASFLDHSMAANMALYCRLDLGINYEGWTVAQTASYLQHFGITDKSTAKVLFSTMVEEPALYPEYGIGYLEFMAMRNKAENALGDDFNLKDFHKFVLDIGPAQFDIINNRMDGWLKAQK